MKARNHTTSPWHRAAASLLLGMLLAATATAQTFERRSVVEEFTGTWCGNCPRGIVGMQRLSEDFADRFIGIAIHTGTDEPMVISTYPEVQNDLIPGSGAPCCIIDRSRYKFDPYSGSGQRGFYHYGIDADFAMALAVPTEAQVELTAQWADDYQGDVRFDVTTTFSIDSPTAPYRLILVLTEDGMKGTGSNWSQVNYFSLDYNPSAGVNFTDDDMSFWRESPYHVDGVEYNHVAVLTYGIRTGIQGSITAPIVAYQPQHYSYAMFTLDSKTQRLIQDKSRLHAIAILINSSTGEVVNAAKTSILPYGADGIRSVSGQQSHTQAPCYDLQGRPVGANRLQRGLYVQQGRKIFAP